jgi:hypothetical protein
MLTVDSLIQPFWSLSGISTSPYCLTVILKSKRLHKQFIYN